ATVEKIVYLPEYQVAFSGWGDELVLAAISHFPDFIRDSYAATFPSAPHDITALLRHFGAEILDKANKGFTGEVSAKRGLIVTTLGQSPRAYRLSIVRELTGLPIVVSIYDQVHATAGDVDNPANLF